MSRDTLLDFFDDRIRSEKPFLVYDGGYRTYTYSYIDIRNAAFRLAERLDRAGINPHDNVILWGENRAEWIVAFWGCLLARAVTVPIDFRASPDLVARVRKIVSARIVITDRENPIATPIDNDVWPLEDLLNDSALRGSEHDAVRQGLSGDDLAEIIFTSGATAEPKGVEITHGNVLANIVPVEREVTKYLKYGRPFFPLRFLNLLPLSHMFGQAMATFVPPMLGGITVFMRGYNPDDIVRQIRTRRVSVLICVPRILAVLRDYMETLMPEVSEPTATQERAVQRWWRYRKVHRLFGFKFWAFVVGAAPLDPELEAFWSRLGFLVIQGYGLTETAPIVTLNHPFRTRRGSVGTPISGVDVQIADDGEVLVRGRNVTRGYYNAPKETASAFRNGWFHTGDIGSVDDSGRLTIRGRKKEMIVTPDGLNVFPEDVERAVRERSGVRDVCIIAAGHSGQERVHAVLVLEDGTDPDAIVRNTNAGLEEHQRIRGYSVWTEASLPRTEGTQKLKRHEVKRWVDSGVLRFNQDRTTRPESIEGVIAQFADGRTLTDDMTLDELGFSSIERIELMLALERACNRSVNETVFDGHTTIANLKTSLAGDALGIAAFPPERTMIRTEPITFPTWSQRYLPRTFRRIALATCLLPLTRLFAWISAEGVGRLAELEGPVLYAANHQSHLDVPVILAALPSRRRHAVATAAALEWFSAHFHPSRFSWWERRRNSLSYYLTVLCFNIVPLPQREAGTRDAMRYLGTLLGSGSSVLIFPEGGRQKTGKISSFLPGVGMLASQLHVPVIPVRIDGINRIWPEGQLIPRPGRAWVRFGDAIHFSGNNYRDIARCIEEAVRAL